MRAGRGRASGVASVVDAVAVGCGAGGVLATMAGRRGEKEEGEGEEEEEGGEL